MKKQRSQFGGSFVEFAITMAFLVVLTQASITLCEKIALKTWVENTSHQLIFASSQSPSSDRDGDIVRKSALLFSIFNSPTREFWKLNPLKSTNYVESGNQSQSVNQNLNYPDVTWNTSTGGLLNIDVQGKSKSLWAGYGNTLSASIVYPLTGSQGFNQEYDSSNNSLLDGSTVVFSCGSSGLEQCTECNTLGSCRSGNYNF